MTKTNMDQSELLARHDQGDFLRGVAEAVLQLVIETDAKGIMDAERHERSGERTTHLGTLNLRVPKLRQGSTFGTSPDKPLPLTWFALQARSRGHQRNPGPRGHRGPAFRPAMVGHSGGQAGYGAVMSDRKSV